MENEKIHLDLFSGIGGASYAADIVWPGIRHIFCEIDDFCVQVLKKHWPEARIHGDIRGFTPDTYNNGFYGAENPESNPKGKNDNPQGQDKLCQPKGGHTLRTTPYLLTGGFPCQPFSQAGRRKGTDDNRHLWPEMLRVIREFRPRWVVGENVAGLLTIQQGLVFQQVCLDLEAEGYEVQSFVIPAVAKNAPHRRDRVWIIAHRNSNSNGRTGGGEKINPTETREQTLNEFEGRYSDVTYPDKREGRPRNESESGKTTHKEPSADDTDSGDVKDPHSKRGRGRDYVRRIKTVGSKECDIQDAGSSWNENWPEVATRLCGVDDGLPVELDGLKLSKSQHRKERLKGLGNAWVPQIAVEIFKAIKEIDQ